MYRWFGNDATSFLHAAVEVIAITFLRTLVIYVFCIRKFQQKIKNRSYKSYNVITAKFIVGF